MFEFECYVVFALSMTVCVYGLVLQIYVLCGAGVKGQFFVLFGRAD